MTVEFIPINGNGAPGRPTTRVRLGDTEVSFPAYRAYQLLKETPAAKPAALARKLKVTKSRWYQLLRELEAAGLVERPRGLRVL